MGRAKGIEGAKDAFSNVLGGLRGLSSDQEAFSSAPLVPVEYRRKKATPFAQTSSVSSRRMFLVNALMKSSITLTAAELFAKVSVYDEMYQGYAATTRKELRLKACVRDLEELRKQGICYVAQGRSTENPQWVYCVKLLEDWPEAHLKEYEYYDACLKVGGAPVKLKNMAA